jgi:hypothetical protein
MQRMFRLAQVAISYLRIRCEGAELGVWPCRGGSPLPEAHARQMHSFELSPRNRFFKNRVQHALRCCCITFLQG